MSSFVDPSQTRGSCREMYTDWKVNQAKTNQQRSSQRRYLPICSNSGKKLICSLSFRFQPRIDYAVGWLYVSQNFAYTSTSESYFCAFNREPDPVCIFQTFLALSCHTDCHCQSVPIRSICSASCSQPATPTSSVVVAVVRDALDSRQKIGTNEILWIPFRSAGCPIANELIAFNLGYAYLHPCGISSVAFHYYSEKETNEDELGDIWTLCGANG